MKKEIFVMLTILSSAMMMRAESSQVTVCMKNGSYLTKSFEEKPRVVSMGASVELKTNTDVLEIHQEDLKKITFGPVSNVPNVNSNAAFYTIDNNNLYVSGETPNSNVSLYGVDGVLLKSAQVGVDGTAKMSLPSNFQGVSVLKSNSINAKIITK